MNVHEAKKRFSKSHLNDNCIIVAVGIRIKDNKSDIVLNVVRKDPSLPKDFHGWKIVQKIASKEAVESHIKTVESRLKKLISN